ncbi:cysteine-rich CWC family protein [Pseudorhodoferax sp.]|uniref:cysteine-rich CWC family protein n=1 Tax=Pseudorhodoferax sp. TaxID=1993553 RepID=UPI0039E5B671
MPAAPAPLPPVDPARCPLCGALNTCAMAAGAPAARAADCWCMRTPVAPAALARLPAERRGLACLCPRCAQG